MKKILTFIMSLVIIVSSSISVSATSEYNKDGESACNTVVQEDCDSTASSNFFKKCLAKINQILNSLFSQNCDKDSNDDNNNSDPSSDSSSSLVPNEPSDDSSSNTDDSCQNPDDNINSSVPSQPSQTPSKPESSPSESTPSTPSAPDESTSQAPSSSEPTSEDNISKFVSEVISLVNEERTKRGISELTINSNLQKAAQIRAEEQEQLFSHTRPNGTSCFTVLSENDVKYRGAGENIAMGQRTPSQVMNSWMNSEGHRKNILNAKFTNIGVGVYKDSKGKNYWTQMLTY